MLGYVFTQVMETGYKSAFRRRGITLKHYDNLDLKDLNKDKFKRDAIYYLGADFPVYTSVLGKLLETEVGKIILELPEHAGIETVIRKSNMAFLPAHSNAMMLETALTSLGVQGKGIKEGTMVWGHHPEMLKTRMLIERISKTDVSIHISGEVGAGKNALADEIAHQRGLKNAVYINCASLSSELAEDMLFGHAKGAYTNASESRHGLCKEADGGILFLDELQDLPQDAQSKLLHLLETGKYRQYGSDRELYSRFKIITSSSLPYDDLKRHLRADFMSRIGTIVINVPPLRERVDDIEELIYAIAGKKGFKHIPDDDEIEMLKEYSWPGNVRELSSVLEYYENLEELPDLKQDLY